MRIGLTGGIAADKTRFENAFLESGYELFDTDAADFLLRTGTILTEKSKANNDYKNDINYKHDIILYHGALTGLVQKLSKNVINNLKKELPLIYDSNGVFSREALLSYINDDLGGYENHAIYNRIIGPACTELYSAWSELVGQKNVISSAMIVERGNLHLIDELYIIRISPENQLRNLLHRERLNGRHISEVDARKAIERQLPFEKKLYLAQRALGKDKVHIQEEDSSLVFHH